MKYSELKSKGFVLIAVSRERSQAEFYYAADISRADQSGGWTR
ncbi:hypothetical protein [Spongiibacter sp.]